eukprot:s1428_g12.t1
MPWEIPCRSRAFAERSICNCLRQSLVAEDLFTSERSSWSRKKQNWTFPEIDQCERNPACFRTTPPGSKNSEDCACSVS